MDVVDHEHGVGRFNVEIVEKLTDKRAPVRLAAGKRRNIAEPARHQRFERCDHARPEHCTVHVGVVEGQPHRRPR